MAMPQPLAEWTLEMVHALPPDGNRYELLDGMLLVSPSPTWRHQEVVARLNDLIRPYVARLGGYACVLAPADVAFTARRMLQPDLFVVPLLPSGRLPTSYADVGRLVLAVEVVSPSTAGNDRYRKRLAYQEQRVAEYWVVDPDAGEVERWRPDDEAPEVMRGRITWEPVAGVAPLEVDIAAVVEDR